MVLNAFEKMQLRQRKERKRKVNKNIEAEFKQIEKQKRVMWVTCTFKRFMKNIYHLLQELTIVLGQLIRTLSQIIWTCKVPLTIMVGTWAWYVAITGYPVLYKDIKTPVIIYENTSTEAPQESEGGDQGDDRDDDTSVQWQGEARITAYSEYDSCHYPDGRGGCLNAYGETIIDGQVACPTKYPKGTKIEIDGIGTFTCMDKTAEWVQRDLGQTFDIWMGYGDEGSRKAKNFGSQNLNVVVYK